MIQYLKRNELDISKYDTCIKLSLNSRVYAFSWYLDIVSDNWDALVLNDYEAVMPLTWRSKYFIKYIYPPAWTQQLGVFSNQKLEPDLIKEFINSIPKKFKKITIQFNSGNDLRLFETEKRVNYILKLDRSYEEIYCNFRNDRKKSRTKSIKQNLTFNNNFNIDSLFQLYNIAFPILNFDRINFNKLRTLIQFCISNNLGFQRNIYNGKIMVAGAFFVFFDNRIYYLFGASTLEGKKDGATTFMIDLITKQHAFSNVVFDFEGSMMDGVADFYKSFGSKEENYTLFKKDNKW